MLKLKNSMHTAKYKGELIGKILMLGKIKEAGGEKRMTEVRWLKKHRLNGHKVCRKL